MPGDCSQSGTGLRSTGKGAGRVGGTESGSTKEEVTLNNALKSIRCKPLTVYRPGSLIIPLGQGLEILVPFYRQQVFLLVITILAGSNDISLRTSASPDEGDHVIHGQLIPAHLLVAIIANTLLDFIAPPVRVSHAAGLFLFPLYVAITYKIHFK